ncbi:branched-chain-amino-acid transaminase [Neoroseomonas oryzicola]|uniref:Branched-chain-amino-acid aminotransferase n=1 Tax=Neoroseomonas oryzicola TaxID=535904 RepID=A0A9X9WMA0_9PROT|nr:branched-chain-amino-acid transaminase [Neoroseomonas oryzicola]MBR0661460.1 branched-chain-amino-acid transaminase [Neoroseomonas oryzicola]NKE19947.1 branched-chain-amino-acid transaminase [Neoroseomonas oryzicola]
MAWTAHSIIQNGKAIPFEEASIHPLAVGVAYGAAVFEGIRAYMNPATGRLSVFRLEEHLARLDQGMKFMRFDDPPSRDVMRQGVLDSIRVNEPDGDCYIRLQVHIESRGTQVTTGKVGWVCAAIPRERNAKRESGLAACVSSWTRIADNTMPARIKATANYHAGRIATLQAKTDGYDMPILLTRDGKVSETAAACLFLVRDGVVITPTRDSDILESVTRDTVLRLAAENGFPVEERRADRTELYVADEVFLCGTGQELSPITTVDRLPVANGKPGPITLQLQAAYEAVVRGTTDAHAAWRTPV